MVTLHIRSSSLTILTGDDVRVSDANTCASSVRNPRIFLSNCLKPSLSLLEMNSGNQKCTGEFTMPGTYDVSGKLLEIRPFTKSVNLCAGAV